MNEDLEEPIQPEEFGLIKIPLPVPPSLEMALGYPGSERYVAFHECRVSRPGVFVEDADHCWPGIEAGWSLYGKHPAVARVLDALHLELKRAVPIIPWSEWIALSSSQREEYWSKTRYLILDRQERLVYVGTHSMVFLFLMMESASRALDSDSSDDISDEEFAAKAQAACRDQPSLPQAEPKLASERPIPIDRTVLERLRKWLDQNEPIDQEYTPGPTISCGFGYTNIAVEAGQIEDAFDYRGGKRYLSLHWSPKANQVFVCDGIGRWSLSGAVDTWNRFLKHPLIEPHLQTRVSDRVEPLDFVGHIEKPADSLSFLSEDCAREMEADVATNCFLYDRAQNIIFTGTWTAALLFHSLVDEPLQEDLAPASSPAPAPLLAWLDEQREAPDQLYAIAAKQNQYGRTEETLDTLRRCVAQDPTSHLYWLRLSQALGSLSQWEEALDACDKAVAFHATAPRQYLTASYMLKWKGQCLFNLKRYCEAADIYRFAMEVDDFRHQGDMYAQLARCYERMGVYREAVNARELQVRDRADALSEALKAREMGEVDNDIVEDERFFLSEAWFDLGRCHLLANHITPAEWALRKAVEANARSSRARAELGALLRRLGHVNEAQEHLENALTLANERLQLSSDGDAYAQLAFVQRAAGNWAAAENTEQRMAELGWKTRGEERRVMSLEVRISGVGGVDGEKAGEHL